MGLYYQFKNRLIKKIKLDVIKSLNGIKNSFKRHQNWALQLLSNFIRYDFRLNKNAN